MEKISAITSNNQRINRAFYFGITLNILFTLVEFSAGLLYDSLALLSDAVHNLSDVGGLIIAFIAYRLSKIAPTKRFTFGFGKTTILASLINSIVLLVVTGGIIKEAIDRFSEPRSTEGMVIVLVAGIGIVINTLTAALFFRDKSGDLNMKGAYLHMAIDAIVSLGVVVSGLIIYYTGWFLIDPLISLIVAVVIIASTWGLFRESLRLTTDAVPESIDTDEVQRAILSVGGTKSVHHIHIWAISTTVNSLTAHVVISDGEYPRNASRIREDIRKALAPLKIAHTTLELESENSNCLNNNC